MDSAAVPAAIGHPPGPPPQQRSIPQAPARGRRALLLALFVVLLAGTGVGTAVLGYQQGLAAGDEQSVVERSQAQRAAEDATLPDLAAIAAG